MRLPFSFLYKLFQRIVNYIVRSVYYQTCGEPVVQMWVKNSIQNCTASFTTLSRFRKLVLIVVVLGGILLYCWPSWLTLKRTKVKLDNLGLCLDEKVQSFKAAAEHFDAAINHKPLEEEENKYLPFVGNGYVGVALDSDAGLFIKRYRALTQPVRYHPVARMHIEGLRNKETVVTDFKSGLIYKMQCYEVGLYCVNIGTQLYAHRTRPAVLVQDFRIHNPSDSPVNIDIEQILPSDWQTSTKQSYKITTKSGNSVDYDLTLGTISLSSMNPADNDKAIPIVIATTKLPRSVKVDPTSTVKYHVVTVVKYAGQPVPLKDINQWNTQLISELQTELNLVLNIDSRLLRQEHTQVWLQLWKSGFGISQSKAQGALNGDKINSTIYYVLSNVLAPLYEVGRTDAQKQALENMLYYPDRCYEGHHTMQNEKMWQAIESELDMARVVTTWLLTLEKQGCATMLRAGASGVLQAMVLSFGALRFSNAHLEFGLHPKDLHRDFFFRRISYGNNTHVNISVIVGEDNKAVLFASVDSNDKTYFACDAGCLDTAQKLSKEYVKFPVKLTDPLTAILYITADREHMDNLKHTVHVREIVEAPAHEHHVLALHRHGHHLGGLPMLFWVSIIFLITVFHLFLFKLIYNEYCQGQERFVRGRYNL